MGIVYKTCICKYIFRPYSFDTLPYETQYFIIATYKERDTNKVQIQRSGI